MMKNIFNFMSAASFAGVLFIITMLVYVNTTREGREEKNKQYIESVVDERVYQMIKSSMPESTGKVAR
jgi:uncharacterized membrane protein|tara:strand:+ start:487 stop:690 length:204 start_codon:yes stop_codon:yes gene_type:complete